MDIKQVDSRLWPFGAEMKVFVPEDNCVYIKSDYTPAQHELVSQNAEVVSVEHPMFKPQQTVMSISDYKPSEHQKKFEIHNASDFMFLRSAYNQK